MNNIYKIVYLILFLIITSDCYSQVSSCPNADFEQNNFSGWIGTTGTCCPINSTVPGIVPGRHTIMSAGTDPNTNGLLSTISPDGQFSARLGNDQTGAEAEQLIYSIAVDASNALFIYRYAVVFEDPAHMDIEQPRFEIRVYDQNNQPVTCGSYNVYSTAGIPGFKTVINSWGSTIHFKDWTTVGINLSAYIGQTVTIEFSTGDCLLGGHFGYAYVDCYCSPLSIMSDFCAGNTTTTLSAPPGFASYQWNTGHTTADITITSPVVGTVYTCTMTSVTGCTVSLSSTLMPTVIASAYALGSNCYNEMQFLDSSVVISGTPINNWQWDFGDGTTGTGMNPVHQYAAPGIYDVTLIVKNKGGCTDTSQTTITVNDIPEADFTFTSACPGIPLQFSDASSGNSSITGWIWDFGDGSANDTDQDPGHIYSLPGTYNVNLIATDANGCRDTVGIPVSTSDAPAADFSYISSCSTGEVIFTDESTFTGALPNMWTWDFGDGSPLVNGIQSPVHIYSNAGSYNVTLIIGSPSGCTDTITLPVSVSTSPIASFTYSNTCDDQFASFINTSTLTGGTITSQHWNFGDGIVSTDKDPFHVYQAPGIYNVELIVTGSNSCTDTLRNPVPVAQSPVADFSVVSVCPGQSAQFTDLSSFPSGNIISWQWNFGDGSLLNNQQNPGHTYISGGTFPAYLIVEGNNGCSDTLFKNVATSPVPVPMFSFGASCAGASLQFNNMSSVSSGSVISSIWDFGDSSPISNDINPTHVYNNSGGFNVTLTVMSDQGCAASATREVTIGGAPNSNFSFTLPCQGAPVQFNDITNPGSGLIQQWTWNFGDGSPLVSGTDAPVHAFANHGVHNVMLVTVNNFGCRDTSYLPVNVRQLPVPGFYSDSPVCSGQSIQFTDTSSIPVTSIQSRSWIFGDGNTSTQIQPVHLFSSANNYTVTLIVTGLNGCRDSVKNIVTVMPLPHAEFSALPVCDNEPVHFIDNSSLAGGSISDWSWSFGDNSASTSNAPVHIYSSPGSYLVNLQVTGSNTCKKDTLISVTVNDLPVAGFNYTPACTGADVNFTDTSIPNSDSLLTWLWTFDDGNTSSLQSPMHVYANTDTFTVSLVVVSSDLCRDTVSKEVIVFPLPEAGFITDTVCLNSETTFMNTSSVISGNIASTSWQFGDGNISMDYNPSHFYSNSGLFNATLNVISDKGCADSISLPVKVFSLPRPAVIPDFISGCEVLPINFRDTSTDVDGIITGWIWDFGDGGSDTIQHPSHVYEVRGVYDVSLQIISSTGCINDSLFSSLISVYPEPLAIFTYTPEVPDMLFPQVQFINRSVDADNYEWEFGDGSDPEHWTSPQHTYEQPGSYTITLISSNNYGCSDTLFRILEVKDAFTLYIPNAFSPNNDGRNDLFRVSGIGITEFNIRIFNRWGKMIWESSDIHNGWDGRHEEDENVQQEVFVYKVDVRDIFNKPHSYTGRITVVR